MTTELDTHFGFVCGLVAETLGQERSAIAYYRSEIRRTSYFKAHYNLARLLSQRRRWRDAIAHYKQAARRSPDRIVASAALNNLGVVYSRQGRARDALATFRVAVLKNPDDPMPRANGALDLLELGDKTKGQRWLNRAIMLHRHNHDADDLIGYALIAYDSDVRRGVRLLERVLAKDGTNARVLADLAVGYMKLGDSAKARRTAKRARRLAPHDRVVARQIELVIQPGKRLVRRLQPAARRSTRPGIRRRLPKR